MAVLDCSQLLLITFTPTSVSVIIVDFDPELWNKLWSKACFLFVSENPSIPTRLDLQIKQMRSQLVNFVHTKSHFLFEMPSFHGSILHKIPCTITNAFFPTVLKHLQVCDMKSAQRESKICVANGQELFQMIYDNLRQEATEVIAFMLSVKDRIFDPKKVNTAPVDYALKGSSMANSDLKKLVNTTRNALKDRNIPVLAEVYDGQWQNFVMTDSENFPLTRMHLQNKSWTRISKLPKTCVIREMMSTCHVPIKNKEKLSSTCISEEGLFLKNIFCKCQTSGGILLQSLGGDLFDGSVSHLFRTCSNLEVWGKYRLKLINERRKQNALLNNNQDTPGHKTDYKSKCGLQPEETNLLSLLLQQVADNLLMQSETEQNNEHIVDNESNLYKVLTAANFNLLNDIKTDLAEHNPGKWTQCKLDRSYPEILCSAQVLNRECTPKFSV